MTRRRGPTRSRCVSIGGLRMSIATTTWAPKASATLIGRLSTIRPSTRRRPSHSTGGNRSGIDMLARTARARSPRASTTGSPVERSPAMARKAMGRRSKSPLRGVAGGGQVLDQEAVDPVLGHQARRDPRPLPVEADADGRGVAVAAPDDGHRPPVRPAAEEGGPVHRLDDVLELVGRPPRGVDAADDGAHAVRGQGIHRNARFLEGAQGADVGDAACAPAGERHRHAGTRARRRRPAPAPGPRPEAAVPLRTTKARMGARRVKLPQLRRARPVAPSDQGRTRSSYELGPGLRSRNAGRGGWRAAAAPRRCRGSPGPRSRPPRPRCRCRAG